MNKRIGVGIVIGIIGGSIAVGAFSGMTNSGRSDLVQEGAWHRKLNLLGDVVDKSYIGKMDRDKLVEGIYKGYVFGIEDDNTVYLTAEEFEKQRVQASGDYMGTGIQFTWGITSQYLIVTEVIPGSPAEEAGIRVGDRITKIDGIKSMMSNEVLIYDKLVYTGPNEVKYEIEDNAGGKARFVKLKARIVKRELIEAQLLGDKVGYVKLKGLRNGTSEELKEILEDLKRKGAQQFIMDIRGTTTDNIEETKRLGDLFLDQKLLFSIQGKGEEVVSYTTQKASFNEPIILVTDKYTEGTLECVVAAFKAHGRGKIVGQKTTGNATVQELEPLEDGSGLKITTGILLTPDNKPIKEEGIIPDIEKRTATEDILKLVTTGSLGVQEDSVIQAALKNLQ